jgi:hypothetical protein
MANKLQEFATAVGTDIKEIKTTLAGKAEKSEVTANGVTQDQLNTAIAQAKTDIIGGAPGELDTLKEIADKISANGGNTDGAVISKIAEVKTELGDRITAIETEDLVSAYNTAKNTL